MEFMRGSIVGQQKLTQVREIGDLKNEMGMLLDSENNCRTSLAGDGGFGQSTLTFKKTDIDGVGDEGKEVELYASKQNGKDRGEKMFSSNSEEAISRYGTLTIDSIKLFMDKNNGSNYTPSGDKGHEDIGNLKVTVENLDEQKQSFDIKLSVFMRTDSNGDTTLFSCSRDSSSRRCGADYRWHPRCGCVTPEVYSRVPPATQEVPNPDEGDDDGGDGGDTPTPTSDVSCQSATTCPEDEMWHDKCGCVSSERYDEIVNNPPSEEDNICDIIKCGEGQKWHDKCGCLTEELYTRANADSTLTCQDLSCAEGQKWHNKCGCLAQTEYERAKQNPNQSKLCDRIVGISYFIDFENNANFGVHNFCTLSSVEWRGPCRNDVGACKVYRNAQKEWIGIKVNEYDSGCGGSTCSAVCFGDSGNECDPPNKMINGKCKSCESPKKWYGKACENCGPRGYCYAKNKCITAPPCPRSPDDTGKCWEWNFEECRCVEKWCPEGGEGGET